MVGSLFDGLGDPAGAAASQKDSFVQRQEMAAGRICAEGTLLGSRYTCMLTELLHPA